MADLRRRLHGAWRLWRQALIHWPTTLMRWWVLAVCALLAQTLPASAQTVAQSPGSVVASDAAQVAELARLLILTGNAPQAVVQLQQAVSVWPDDPEIHFLLGVAREATGDLSGAVAAFGTAFGLDTSRPRPLLEQGRLLAQQGAYEDAYRAFDRALLLADDRMARRNIRKFLGALEPHRVVTGGISIRLQPDSNPSAVSGQNEVIIAGQPFTLDNDSRKKAGLGLGIDGAMRYAHYLTNSLRAVVDVGFNGLHFFDACCSDYNILLAAGAGWWWDQKHVVVQGYTRYRLYNDRPYALEQGVRFETSVARADYALRAGSETGTSRLIALNVPGHIVRAFVGGDYRVAGGTIVGLTLRGEKHWYSMASQAFTAATVSAYVGFEGPWQLPMRVTASSLNRMYEGATLTSNGKRVDWQMALSAEVQLDMISIWGMLPTLGMIYQRQTSTDTRGRFNRLTGLMSLTKYF